MEIYCKLRKYSKGIRPVRCAFIVKHDTVAVKWSREANLPAQSVKKKKIKYLIVINPQLENTDIVRHDTSSHCDIGHPVQTINRIINDCPVRLSEETTDGVHNAIEWSRTLDMNPYYIVIIRDMLYCCIEFTYFTKCDVFFLELVDLSFFFIFINFCLLITRVSRISTIIHLTLRW